MPPVAERAALYAVPEVAVGRAAVVIASFAGPIVIAMLVVAACGDAAESVTSTPKMLSPADVGVPVMLPEVESARPAGSCPERTFHL